MLWYWRRWRDPEVFKRKGNKYTVPIEMLL
jgi:hypothetical protein